MGTTADKLQAVLSSKNAIRDKFNLGDIPFSQYAESINAGGGSPDGAEFYKCVNVVPVDYSKVSYIVRTADDWFSDREEYCCEYRLDDASAKGNSRIWRGFIPINSSGAAYLGDFGTIEYKTKDGVSGWFFCGLTSSGTYPLEFISSGADPEADYLKKNRFIEGGDDLSNYGLRALKLYNCNIVGGDSQNPVTVEWDGVLRRENNWISGDFRLEMPLSGANSENSWNRKSYLYYKDTVIYEFEHIPGAAISQFAPLSKGHACLLESWNDSFENSSWTGQKIEKGSEGYDLTNETENFIYNPNNSIVPKVGGIYDTKSLISVNRMYKDLFTEGGSGSAFYLCGYVNRTYQTNEFRVSGLPTDIFKDLSDWEGNLFPEQFRTGNPNGTFAPYYKEGELSNWRWRNENGVEAFFNGMNMAWVFAPFYENDEYYISSYPVSASAGYENIVPIWDSSLQWTDNSGNTISFDIAEVVQPPVEPYWEGYKLEADENGKYNFASDKTKLTYGDYMPVAGRIYDAACSLEITNADLTEDALWACPHGMTSNENDEWKVSIVDNKVQNNQEPYYAFDGSNLDEWESTAFKGDNASNQWFLQWQNKQRPVLLKVLYGMPGGGDWGWRWDDYDWQVLGSNNGEDWDILFKGRWKEDGSWGTTSKGDYMTKRKILIEGSFGPYSYYRLGVASSNNLWQAHHIEAFSQLPREVPK